MNRNPLPSIRRYASHYLWVPGEGYLRQQVVEVRGCRAVRHYPLPGEVEGVEWLPGVIVLLPGRLLCPALPADISSLLSLLLSSDGASPSPAAAGEGLLACHLFPFDLTALQPVAGTRHRLLP